MIEKPRLRIIFRPEGFYIQPVNQQIQIALQLVLNPKIEVLRPSNRDMYFVVSPYDVDMANQNGILFKR